MEKIKNTSNFDIHLPPGFRFHPTDEELIVHYLQKRVTSTPLPASIFAEIELYKFNPWELPCKALFGGDEWFFLSPRDRKYPNGVRPNRMAASGYWKATGTDRPILGSCDKKIVGVKKALVFYKGRPPTGVKTDWIMHEYRLLDTVTCISSKPKESMRLDDWVLCRVRQKSCTPRNFCKDTYRQINPEVEGPMIGSMNINPIIGSFKGTLFKDCPMLPFIFGSHLDFTSMDTISSSISFEGSKNSSYSSDNEGNFQEPFGGLVGSEGKRKETNQEEGLDGPNKRLRTMKDRTEELGLPGINRNDMGFGSEEHYDLWKYIME